MNNMYLLNNQINNIPRNLYLIKILYYEKHLSPSNQIDNRNYVLVSIYTY